MQLRLQHGHQAASHRLCDPERYPPRRPVSAATHSLGCTVPRPSLLLFPTAIIFNGNVAARIHVAPPRTPLRLPPNPLQRVHVAPQCVCGDAPRAQDEHKDAHWIVAFFRCGGCLELPRGMLAASGGAKEGAFVHRSGRASERMREGPKHFRHVHLGQISAGWRGLWLAAAAAAAAVIEGWRGCSTCDVQLHG